MIKKRSLYMAKTMGYITVIMFISFLILAFILPDNINHLPDNKGKFKALLVPSRKFNFNSFVDCNMAEAWIGDTFRIFPGKYGEDPLWGYAHDLKFADGFTVDEAFTRKQNEFTEPSMPENALPGKPGLHGAVWFETIRSEERRVGKECRERR